MLALLSGVLSERHLLEQSSKAEQKKYVQITFPQKLPSFKQANVLMEMFSAAKTELNFLEKGFLPPLPYFLSLPFSFFFACFISLVMKEENKGEMAKADSDPTHYDLLCSIFQAELAGV